MCVCARARAQMQARTGTHTRMEDQSHGSHSLIANQKYGIGHIHIKSLRSNNNFYKREKDNC